MCVDLMYFQKYQIGASIALNISDIPFDKIVGGIKVGLVDGQLVLNPNL